MQQYWNIYFNSPGRGAKLIFCTTVKNYLINLKFSILYDPTIHFQVYSRAVSQPDTMLWGVVLCLIGYLEYPWLLSTRN